MFLLGNEATNYESLAMTTNAYLFISVNWLSIKNNSCCMIFCQHAETLNFR